MTEQDYADICERTFAVNNIDTEGVKTAFAIVDDFLSALNQNKRQILRKQSEEGLIDFGIGLYYALMYDRNIINPTFRHDVAGFPSLYETACIGESVYGDIRVFFI